MIIPKRTQWQVVLLGLSLTAGRLLAAAGPETQIQYLSGTGKDDAVPWDFYCTAGMQSGVWKQIAVPSCWELQGFGVYNYAYAFRPRKGEDILQRPGFAAEQGKYRTEFAVPASWQGKVVRLVFEGVMVRTEAFVNGQSVGPAHEGGFYEFKYDITPLLKFGATNRLEVTVSKVPQDQSVMRAERQGDFWNFGGIFRPVLLEVLPAAYIDWTGIDGQANGDFKADLHLGPGVRPETAEVTAQVLDSGGRPVGAPFSAKGSDFARGQGLASIQLRAHFDGVKRWTAETPNLYRVQFTLLQNGVAQHTVTNRFGFRTIELRRNDGFYVNGTKIVMKGVNRHSFWADSGRTLSKALCYDDARLIKDLNMNAVRMSHYPPDRDFLDACDELGIYVLDELTGWGGHYDTPVGQRLVGEMVRRDVDHPCVLVWDNGNEGGWNNDLDQEFAKWDVQQRIVMHPRSTDHGVNDPHYPDYAKVVAESGGPAVYFPTEYLHGLYDGGSGSAFHDYWEVLRKSPVLGGAFFWVLFDDGVVRTDKGGIIDNAGDFGPDGIMGPRREKEGSYYTIKEIWSPVEVEAPAGGLFPGFQGAVKVRNSYDFTDLGQCSFAWEYARFPKPGSGQAGHTVLARGELPAPAAAPHQSADLNLSLPAAQGVEAVYLTAKNPSGQTLWTWSWPVAPAADPAPAAPTLKVAAQDSAAELVVRAGVMDYHFSKATGRLIEVFNAGAVIPLGDGPRFVAYARDHLNHRPITYADLAGPSTLTGLTTRPDGDGLVVEADYAGAFKQAKWSITPDGRAKLSYAYALTGPVDLLGVDFDFPEAEMRGVTWLGFGPYHSWQNRLQGTRLDVWHNPYNNLVPSVTYSSNPDFKGYFRAWRWANFETADGPFTVRTNETESYLGLYTPNDGPVGPLLALPKTGLAFFDVIPAMRTKFLTQDRLGPQSAPKQVSGEHTGEVAFDFSGK